MAEDDDILALQRELAAVQEEDTMHRLSERNVIEILLKCVKLGLIEIIYTCNGKAFLTPQQLKLELQDELLAAGGRLALADVQPLLNVDIVHIEKAAAELVQSQEDLLYIQGELIASYYLDGLVEEVLHQLLPDAGGKLILANLAAQTFNLSVPLTEKAIKERLSTDTHTHTQTAKLKNGVLYTQSYETTQRARIRGVCAGVTRPVSLSELVNLYGFDEALLEDVVPKLIKEGTLAGTLRGREYMPTAFLRTQRECIDAFFQQNGYIETTRAQKLQVNRALEYLRQSFPDALPLGKKLIVSSSVLKDLEANIDESVIINKGWLDIMSVVPPILSTSEAALLLLETAQVRGGTGGGEKHAVALAETYVVSMAFLQEAIKEVEGGRLVAKKVAEGLAGGGKRGGGSGGGGDELMDSSSGGGGKRSGKKGGKRGADIGSPPSASTIIVTEIETILVKWQPPLEKHFELTHAIAGEIQGEIQRLIDSTIASAALSSLQQSGGAAARRKEQKTFEEDLETASMTLQLLARSLYTTTFATEEDKKDLTSLLLKSRGAQLADLISTRACKLHEVTYASVHVNPHAPSQPSITLEQRDILRADLPKGGLAEGVVKMWTIAVKGRPSLDDLLDLLPSHLCPALDALYRKLDKKKEKTLTFARRMTLSSQLTHSESPSEILLVGYQLVLLLAKGIVLLPSQQEAEEAVATQTHTHTQTACPPLVEVLSRTAAATVGGGGGGEMEGGGGGGGSGGWSGLEKVQELERVYKEYVTCEEGGEKRSELARALLEAQAGVKEAFAKKGGSGGGGGGDK